MPVYKDFPDQSTPLNAANLNLLVQPENPAPVLLAPAKTKWAKQEVIAPPTTTGATVDIFTATGQGIVWSIWTALAAGGFGVDGRLQVFVDGEADPSIDIDFGTLFLLHNEAGNQAGGFSCWTPHWHGESYGGASVAYSGRLGLPIPYSNGITIRMMNPNAVGTGNNSTYWQVIHSPGVTTPYRLKSYGHSWAGGSATTACPGGAATPAAGSDQALADIVPGTGKSNWLAWYGMCETPGIGGGLFNGNQTYLERNVQITVDGEGTPSILSSGTEDFFFGSFYWQLRNHDSNGVAVASGANEPGGTCNEGLDVLALCNGFRFETELKMDLLTEAAVTTGHTMSWVLLYYSAI